MAAGKSWVLWLTLIAAALLPAQAQEVFYIHTDALGTVVAETDANGNVVQRSEYEPYGRVLNRPVKNGPGYTGHVEDAATGLTYMQQRYYDPGVGRFLSVDPVTAYDTGDYRFFTRYAYAFNNPYKFTDPDGRSATCDQNTCTIDSHSILETVVDYGTVGLIIARRLLENAIVQSESNQPDTSPDAAPDLPTGLVGDNPRATGKNGGEAVGTSLPGEKFPEVVEGLTGGTLGAPNDKGRSTAPNGVSVRTGGKDGPRIDIPANGTKPPEIIHFPENTPIPENLKPNP